MATASKVVFFSASPFGTGDIKTGSPTLTISSGVATLTVAQTGNIGAGDCIDFGGSNTKVYIAPCRIAFNSGDEEIEIHDKLKGDTSSATGIVRAVELTSGSWAGGDAAGYVYFRKVTGTFNSSENLSKVRPTASSNVAATNGSLQGNMSDEFVVKDPDGTETSDVGSAQTVNSIHHEYASLNAFEAGFTDSNHINSTNLITSDLVVHATAFYDHDDYTTDSDYVSIDFGSTDSDHFVYIYTPIGDEESINNQRHLGKWNSQRYILEELGFVLKMVNYTKIEGLQFFSNSNDSYRAIIRAESSGVISHNLIKADFGGGSSGSWGIYVYYATVSIYNNIIYDIINGSKSGFYAIYAVGSFNPVKVYNNTIYNCTNGMGDYDGIAIVPKNNILQEITTDPFTNISKSTGTHNIIDSSIATGAFGITYSTGVTTGDSLNKLIDSGASFISDGVKVGCIIENTTDSTYTRVTAIDSETQLSIENDIFDGSEGYKIYTNKYGTVTFHDAGNDDFHIGAGDAFAKNLGQNLTSEEIFWDDIDGDER